MLEVLTLQIGKAHCAEFELYGSDASCTSCSGCASEAAPSAPPPSEDIDYCCYAYLVRSNSRLILVDTGFNSKCLAHQVGCDEYRSVVELLGQINILPEQITDVVITHAHWSNMGALSNFLKARIFISIREINAMEKALDSQFSLSPYRWEDMNVLGLASKLHMVKRGLAIDENLRLDVIGGHSPGFLLPTVMYQGVSRLMLAGDNLPMYKHLQGAPLPQGWCPPAETVLARLKQRTQNAFILPGRDPAVMKRYPQVAPGIVQILNV